MRSGNCDPVDWAARLQAQIDGYQQTALIYVAAKLGFADILAAGATGVDALSAQLDLPAKPLQRILRALATLDFCYELEDGTFALAEAGHYLRRSVPGSQRNKALLAVEQYWAAWGEILYSASTGKPAFERAHGMTPWAFRQKNPELNACFNSWLAAETQSSSAAILAACDLTGAVTIVDIGGGDGALLVAALQENPQMEGILFDQPHVVEAVDDVAIEQSGLGSRLKKVGGNMFEAIPSSADIYLMKSVIHDWSDSQSKCILENCRMAMKRTSKLLLVERLLPERAIDTKVCQIDMHMMVVTGGEERSLTDYQALIADADLSVTRVIATDSGFSIMEVVLNDG